MDHHNATKEQIEIIKRLHYETGNIRASLRPYTRMRYISALREIEMLKKKLAKMNKPKKNASPMDRYTKEQLKELAIVGEAFIKNKVTAKLRKR